MTGKGFTRRLLPALALVLAAAPAVGQETKAPERPGGPYPPVVRGAPPPGKFFFKDNVCLLEVADSVHTPSGVDRYSASLYAVTFIVKAAHFPECVGRSFTVTIANYPEDYGLSGLVLRDPPYLPIRKGDRAVVAFNGAELRNWGDGRWSPFKDGAPTADAAWESVQAFRELTSRADPAATAAALLRARDPRIAHNVFVELLFANHASTGYRSAEFVDALCGYLRDPTVPAYVKSSIIAQGQMHPSIVGDPGAHDRLADTVAGTIGQVLDAGSASSVVKHLLGVFVRHFATPTNGELAGRLGIAPRAVPFSAVSAENRRTLARAVRAVASDDERERGAWQQLMYWADTDGGVSRALRHEIRTQAGTAKRFQFLLDLLDVAGPRDKSALKLVVDEFYFAGRPAEPDAHRYQAVFVDGLARRFATASAPILRALVSDERFLALGWTVTQRIARRSNLVLGELSEEAKSYLTSVVHPLEADVFDQFPDRRAKHPLETQLVLKKTRGFQEFLVKRFAEYNPDPAEPKPGTGEKPETKN